MTAINGWLDIKKRGEYLFGGMNLKFFPSSKLYSRYSPKFGYNWNPFVHILFPGRLVFSAHIYFLFTSEYILGSLIFGRKSAFSMYKTAT